MKQCHDIHEQLSAYLDGQLSASERNRVETHLVACTNCRAELARLRQLDERLRGMPAPVVPTDVWTSVAAHISGVPRTATGLAFPPLARRMAAAAMLALVFGCGYLLGIARGRSEPTPAHQLPVGIRTISLPAVEQRMAMEVIKATMLDGGATGSDRLDSLLGRILTEELRSDAAQVLETQGVKKSNGV